MAVLFDPALYEPSVLSLPFLVVGFGILLILLYVVLLRGARLLRTLFLLAYAGVLSTTLGFVLVGSIRDAAVAETIYKLALALLPLSTASVFAFQAALVQRLARFWLLVLIAFGSALFHAVVMPATDWYIDGVWETSSGLPYFRAGPLYPVFLIGTTLWIALALGLGWRHLPVEPSPRRRRQIRRALVAFAASGGAAVDIPLAYGVGVFPVGWMFLCVGAVLALPSLIQDALVETRARDRRVPMALLYLSISATGVWVIWSAAGDLPLLVLVPLLLLLYLALRTVIMFGSAITRPAAALTNTLLERLAEQHATRIQSLDTATECAALTSEILELGLGCKRVELLLPSRRDWSWYTLSGEKHPEDAGPSPWLRGSFTQDPQLILREDRQSRRSADQREEEEIARLFEKNQAEVMVPLVSRDEIVGLLILSGLERGAALLPEELDFLARIQEQAGLALDYARMHQEANARVEVFWQMELAAAVQSAFVPKGELIECGAVRISGLWAPASRCGGDWWWVHDLADGRVLVLIGDVTGHGLPSAMVTAAAKGCYDVAQRLMGSKLDVVELLLLLDAAVRAVSGDAFHMTCFASLLDPAAGTVTYANAGHLVPYLCRPLAEGGVELGVLSARGTPLGASRQVRYRAHTRELKPGDALVWYTDGIVESVDRGGRQFGDRRLQRLLRKIDHASVDARGIRDHIVRAVLAFQGGVRAEDDITLVVARVEADTLHASSGGEESPGENPRHRDISTSRATSRSHLQHP